MFQVSRRRCGPSCEPEPSRDRERDGSNLIANAIISNASAVNKNFAHISSLDVFAIEDRQGQQQNAKRVSAADAAVMTKAFPGDLGLEHVAPKVHVGREEVRPQVLKE